MNSDGTIRPLRKWRSPTGIDTSILYSTGFIRRYADETESFKGCLCNETSSSNFVSLDETIGFVA